jgi:hypothetical protein
MLGHAKVITLRRKTWRFAKRPFDLHSDGTLSLGNMSWYIFTNSLRQIGLS